MTGLCEVLGEILHPILFSVGPFHVATYGTLAALAVLAAFWTVLRLGRREGLDSGQLFEFSTWLLLVAFVGAKMLMVISDWGYYRQYPGEILSWSTLRSGGVFYGGFIAALLFAVWYIRLHHLPFWKVVDVYAPAISLGLGLGRIGCFAAGCDYGKPTTSAWGVVFTNPIAHETSGVPLGIPLYPTQPIMSLTSLSIFAILMWRYPRKSRDGEIFVLYLALYAVARFFIEFLRGDEDRGFVFHHLLSTSQFIAILALATAVCMALVLRRKPARQRARGVETSDSEGRGNRGDKKVPDEVAPSARVKPAPMPHAPKGTRN
jgi:phosphatidylglycerol:prolipoprotein diacylglycerol transferase